MTIVVGQRVGAYTFLRELGRGGMGTVYLADDHELGKQVAIKVLHPQFVDDAVVLERFRNEVRAAAAIDHPAIVKSRPIERLPNDGPWCCVMEYVEAPTLKEFCKARGGPLSLGLILEIVGPICEAFDLLHALHIVHRDLKPENVLIIQRGGHVFPRVLDFGVAKRTNEPGLTRPGVAPGTAAYSAPEQASGGTVDRTCDVYSLGVMIYWMATGGHLPYEVPDGLVYLHQMSEPPADPRRRYSDISELAASVIMTAICREPARRPKSMGALALMLSRAHPNGIDILYKRAPNLLIAGNLDETLRSPGPHGAPRGSSGAIWKYDYGPVLGRGGMAEVIRATQRGQGQFAVPRAIKLILPEFAAAPDFMKWFNEEARTAALLDHRNIVKVTDYDVDPHGRHYIAMDFIDGLDLDKLVKSGPLPHAVTIFVLCEVLAALKYVHDLPPPSPLASAEEIAVRGNVRGLVHRDVSPHNVLVSWQAEVKLSDFGIAKLRSATAADGSQMIKGKPGYMSPEQASTSSTIDGRSDLWAIGVMLWEMLTGQRLFNHDSLAQILSAVLWEDIPRPAVVQPGVPPELDAITMRLLQRDLSLRFQKAQDVMEALSASPAASITGREELSRFLVERFPDRAPRVSDVVSASERRANETSSPGASTSPARPHAFAVSAPKSAPGVWESSSTTGHAIGEALAPRVQPSHRGRWFVVLAIAAAAVTFFALIAWPARHETNDAARGAVSDAAPRPRSGSAAAPEASAAPPITLDPAPPASVVTVTTSPVGAVVRIEGAGVATVSGRAPLTVDVPRGTQLHIQAELPGYEPLAKDASVRHEKETIIVTLASLPAPTATAKTVEQSGTLSPTRRPAQAKRPSTTPEVAPGIME
jgi:serine/threonine protein kinase